MANQTASIWATALALLLAVVSSCRSKEPYVGTIIVDTDLPILHKGYLPIGVTLDPGKGGRDLLSPNLLLNGNFELASRPDGVGYDYTKQEVVTPNGSRLHYPLPEQMYGWEVLGGDITVESISDNHFLKVFARSTDSIVAFTQKLQGFSTEPGAAYRFSMRANAIGNASVTVRLTNDSLQPLAPPLLFTLNRPDSLYSGPITVTQSSPESRLLITIEVPEGEAYQVVTDSTSYWTRRSTAAIQLDRLQLTTTAERHPSGIDLQLFDLLDSLAPSFVRYPSGRTANGLYPGTYPIHLDTLPNPPLWTLRKNELTGDFDYKNLLSLAKALRSDPILVTNFGFTDPSTIQRTEDIKLLPQRIDYINRIISESRGAGIAIEPGYNLNGYEYNRRFTQLLNTLDTIHPNLQLISAGDRSPYNRYSDYPYDQPLPGITYDNLPLIDSLLTNEDPLLFPRMSSEVTFNNDYTDGYFLPPLALRVAFLLLAEHHTPNIRALGIEPLLSTDLQEDFPIIAVTGGHYHPTLLYQYLQDFKSLRGKNLCRLPEDKHLNSDIFVSLTTNDDRTAFYLKAVNVTRHPLNYQIKLTGKNNNLTKTTIVSYTSTQPSTSDNLEGFTHYRRREFTERLPFSGLYNYLFAPYEVVIFKFE
ncbi:MAG: hypothetical protein Q4E10_03635 [Porphyromonas sp.]|nr:hypothetical protein [Porphyromonas sp.]